MTATIPPQTASGDHSADDNQTAIVVAGTHTAHRDQTFADSHIRGVAVSTHSLADQPPAGTQMTGVGEDLSPPATNEPAEPILRTSLRDSTSPQANAGASTNDWPPAGITHSSNGQRAADTQSEFVVAGPLSVRDQAGSDTETRTVAVGSTSPETKATTSSSDVASPGISNPDSDQDPGDTRVRTVAVGPNSGDDQCPIESQASRVVAGPTSPATTLDAAPKSAPSRGISNSATDQLVGDLHGAPVGGALSVSQVDHSPDDTHPRVVDLADPFLRLAAEGLDDLERNRIANENRLRQITRSVEDKDGEERGLGLPIDHPDVAPYIALVAGMNCQSPVLKELGWERPRKERGKACCLEHLAVANLERRMRSHPLAAWVDQAKGIGDKQAARLLAAIGDPYIRPRVERLQEDGTVTVVSEERPRKVSELWSYAGYGDAEKQVRRKGVKANWSDDAKKRAFLVSESCAKQLKDPCYSVKNDKGEYLRGVHVEECVCSPYRVVYDETRAKYADAVHDKPCVRCGPKGKPAEPGSPLSRGHIKARAYRAMSKTVLKDLWREARRLHGFPDDQTRVDAQAACVVGASNPPTGQLVRDTHSAAAGGSPTPPRTKDVADPGDEPSVEVSNSPDDQTGNGPQGAPVVGAQSPLAAKTPPVPRPAPLPGDPFSSSDQRSRETQRRTVAGAPSPLLAKRTTPPSEVTLTEG